MADKPANGTGRADVTKNGVYQKNGGKALIRNAMADAQPVPPDSLVPEALISKFKMIEGGLHKKNRDDGLRWISARFTIEAETEDDAGRFGILLKWIDRNGREREENFGRELFAGECGELRVRLASGGLAMQSHREARANFAEYLNLISSQKRARVVSKTGWHKISGARVFVLPDQVIGLKSMRVILERGPDRPPFNCQGSLDDWRNSVSALARGNSRLLLAICVALAGPLLEICSEDGGGLNLRGTSRTGKTSVLRVAASVWGGEAGQGSAAYVQSWRATGNALESVAAMHSDTSLILDELGQVDPREAAEIAYLLASGSGKTRSNRAGAMRVAAKFRVLFLSSGEVGLADINASAKKVTRAGQAVRFIDVEADAGCDMGVFETLHEADSADAFVEQLRASARVYFGTAGPAFVTFLISKFDRDIEFAGAIKSRIEDVIRTWVKPYGAAGGQMMSVARRFGMIAVAGELATEGEITGWAPGEAAEACYLIFKEWVSARGTTGALEDEQAVTQLRSFISLHGSSRFEDWKRPDSQAGDQVTEESAPVERFRISNRAGWRKWEQDANGRGFFDYYLLDEGMKEVLSGLDKQAAIKVLVERGFIEKAPDGKSTVSRRPPGSAKSIRLFKVKASVMGRDDHGE